MEEEIGRHLDRMEEQVRGMQGLSLQIAEVLYAEMDVRKRKRDRSVGREETTETEKTAETVRGIEEERSG